ncbi:MAG: dihydrofolate reductase family protein [Candidatus Margulisbacteria bacterium]|nr:dihydrofolate reductase family protein [Candidatus Margulisiibacteriota bacterium]
MVKVIIHNSISLDGALTGFMPDMALHYKLTGKYRADATLVGSDTALSGFKLFGMPAAETLADFIKPKRSHSLPFWVIPDTRGKLKGLLHGCRRFEYCRDIIVLVSEQTPREYLDYLAERHYDFRIAGQDHVELKQALALLVKDYKVKTILTDTGQTLINLLIEQDLAAELSLLVHPLIIGKQGLNIFGNLRDKKLTLLGCKKFPSGHIWLTYKLK